MLKSEINSEYPTTLTSIGQFCCASFFGLELFWEIVYIMFIYPTFRLWSKQLCWQGKHCCVSFSSFNISFRNDSRGSTFHFSLTRTCFWLEAYILSVCILLSSISAKYWLRKLTCHSRWKQTLSEWQQEDVLLLGKQKKTAFDRLRTSLKPQSYFQNKCLSTCIICHIVPAGMLCKKGTCFIICFHSDLSVRFSFLFYKYIYFTVIFCRGGLPFTLNFKSRIFSLSLNFWVLTWNC